MPGVAKKRKKPEGIPDMTPEFRKGGLRDCNPLHHITWKPRNPLHDRRDGREIHRAKLLAWYEENGRPATVMHNGSEIPFPPVLLNIMKPDDNRPKGPRS